MTMITSAPATTAILFKGLDNLVLPFTSHVFDGVEDSQLDAVANVLSTNDDKYFVKSVSGLEPPQRNVAIARTAAGGSFQGVTVEDRELVVLIGLNPDYDAGETPKKLRDELYTLLYTGYDPKVDIMLVAGIFPYAHEYGYITNFEASIFEKDPAVQLTFTMLNPTFRAYSENMYEPSDLSETAPDIYNYATAETGFKFAVKFTGSKNGWFIKQAEDQNIGMIFDYAFTDGDTLSVSTVPGQKYVHLRHGKGKVKNALDILTAGSEWIQLHPGHNHFVVPKKLAVWEWNGNLSFLAQFAGS